MDGTLVYDKITPPEFHQAWSQTWTSQLGVYITHPTAPPSVLEVINFISVGQILTLIL